LPRAEKSAGLFISRDPYKIKWQIDRIIAMILLASPLLWFEKEVTDD
jgi:hypothetical protein